ncbi:MAG: glutaminase [Bacteroidales bacterium]|nr:glutaminase [Bacteroidales bacterium]MBN2756715.1 glutaminase [Bacteroidales bacterium]
MDYQKIIEKIYDEVKPLIEKGIVADYIPALAKTPANKFAMTVSTVNGEEFCVGDVDDNFSIQSISKVFTLTIAMNMIGDDLWKRVGREPSGNSFNSLVQLEYENGIPRNPFINAGAIVVSDAIFEGRGKTKNKILQFVREISGNNTLSFDEEVAESERIFGNKNRAMANFIKSFNNLNNLADDVLDIYFHQCSICMNTKDLAHSFLFLANKGINPKTGDIILGTRKTKRMNSLMLTCGLYDAVGDFAYRVGLPGKSGVGGGIVAVVPGELSVAVWSPGLNKYGNSLAGTKALELFTTYANNSIF